MLRALQANNEKDFHWENVNDISFLHALQKEMTFDYRSKADIIKYFISKFTLYLCFYVIQFMVLIMLCIRAKEIST